MEETNDHGENKMWKEDKLITRTALGRKLLAIRKKAIAKGLSLLSEEEVLKLVEKQRGLSEDQIAEGRKENDR